MKGQLHGTILRFFIIFGEAHIFILHWAKLHSWFCYHIWVEGGRKEPRNKNRNCKSNSPSASSLCLLTLTSMTRGGKCHFMRLLCHLLVMRSVNLERPGASQIWGAMDQPWWLLARSPITLHLCLLIYKVAKPMKHAFYRHQRDTVRLNRGKEGRVSRRHPTHSECLVNTNFKYGRLYSHQSSLVG